MKQEEVKDVRSVEALDDWNALKRKWNESALAETQTRKGCWFELNNEHLRYQYWRCSECGFVVGAIKGICKYCPNCGAKMDEVENEID